MGGNSHIAQLMGAMEKPAGAPAFPLPSVQSAHRTVIEALSLTETWKGRNYQTEAKSPCWGESESELEQALLGHFLRRSVPTLYCEPS